jgi:hypothetical protein
MKLNDADRFKYAYIREFCATFLTEAEVDVDLERLIDAVEVGTGYYSPFLVEVYLYENKIAIEEGLVKNAELEDL